MLGLFTSGMLLINKYVFECSKNEAEYLKEKPYLLFYEIKLLARSPRIFSGKHIFVRFRVVHRVPTPYLRTAADM